LRRPLSEKCLHRIGVRALWIERAPQARRKPERAGGTVSLSCLIDDQGKVWYAGAPDLRRRLGYPDPDFDLPAYAVRNLGYVKVRQRRGSAHVSLRPSLVRPPALAGLFYHLAEAMPDRLLLSYLLRDWQHELIRSAHEAMLRLEDLVCAASVRHPPSTYLVQRHPLAPRRHSAMESLSPLLAVWHLTSGRYPDRLVDMLATLGLRERAVVHRNPAGTDRLIFDHRGTAFSHYPPSWNLLAVGRDIEDQPDRAYAARTAATYRAVLQENEPRFEAVDAVITTPGDDMLRSRYDRLILPWCGSDGDRFVTGVSMLRTSYILDCA
jgi:hypothetical protein